MAGATGNVGREMLAILAERRFPVSEVVALASSRIDRARRSRSATRFSSARRSSTTTSPTTDICLMSAGGAVSKEWSPQIGAQGCVVIDNSSAWRMDPDVPLVVPGGERRRGQGLRQEEHHRQSQLLDRPARRRAEAAARQARRIKRVVVATYQSVSGAGKDAMDELFSQTRAVFTTDPIEPKKFPKRIAFNLIPQIDVFMDDGSTKEEWKMVAETKKILDPKIKLTATCVRVPVFISHSEAVNIEFEQPITADEARDDPLAPRPAAWSSTGASPAATSPRTRRRARTRPTSAASARTRRSRTASTCGCVSDNLRKGAALNAVQIAEVLVNRGWLKAEGQGGVRRRPASARPLDAMAAGRARARALRGGRRLAWSAVAIARLGVAGAHFCSRFCRTFARSRSPWRKPQDHRLLTSPRIFLVGMAAFLALVGFVAMILYKQIEMAFRANPGLNSLIIGVLVIGSLVHLSPGVPPVSRNPLGQFARRRPGAVRESSRLKLLGPMATMLNAGRGRARPVDDARPAGDPRFDRHPPRRGARAQSLSRRSPGVPRPARHLLGPARDRPFDQRRHRQHEIGKDTSTMFDDLKTGLSQPIAGMSVSFTSSLFGLAELADPRLPRSPGRPGAEPILHRPRGFPGGHVEMNPPAGQRSRRRRPAKSDRAAAQRGGDGNLAEGIQSLVTPYAPGAAADPRLGQRPGGPARGLRKLLRRLVDERATR